MKKRLLSLALVAAMVISLIPATLLTTAQAAEDTGAFGIKTPSEMTPEETAASENNPFGALGTGTFPLLVKSELFVTYGWDGNSKDDGKNYVRSYDATDKSGQLPDFNVNNGTRIGYADSVGESGNAYIATAVDGFNPGSGKDEYVVMLGLNAQSRRIDLSITDKNGLRVSRTDRWVPYAYGTRMGDDLQWLMNLESHQYNGFLSVVSGDFDGDGMDSIILYEVGASNAQTPYLQEYNVTNSTAGTKKFVLTSGDQVMDNLYTVLDGDVSDLTSKDAKNAPKVQMEAADTDKDGYDELVVTVSMNDTYYGENMKHLGTQVFIYDKLDTGWELTARFSMKNDGVSDDSSYADDQYRMVWGTSTVGNVITSDDSGVITDFPEIVTAGLQDNESSKMYNINVDGKDKMVYSIIHCTGMTEKDTGMKNYQGNYVAVGYGTLDANKFTEAGIYENEDVSPLLQTKCFSYKGAAEAEAVFISGSVYTWEDKEAGGGELEHLYTADFYDSDSKNADNSTADKMQVESIAAGNFDGNEDGREQIVSAYLLKEKDKNNGFSGLVTIGYYDSSETDEEGKWQSETAPGNNFISKKGKAYVALTDFDCDEDSIIVEYQGVEKQWSDPEVMAILVASPYFHDIGLDNNSCTDYGIDRSTENSSETSHSLTTNLVVGYEYESLFGNGGGVEATIENNFTWSSNNSRTVTYSTNYSNNTEESQVVVYRSPVLVYQYKNVNNKDEDIYFAKTLSPVTTMISVEEYNKQAEGYDWLNEIDETKLGIPGLPDTYPSTKKQIKTSFGLANENDVLLGDTTWGNYSAGGTITKGVSIGEMSGSSFNYEFDFSFTAYGIAFGFKAGGGAGYGYETTKSVVNGTEISRSGTVEGVGETDYDFNWNFATWTVKLNGLKIPVCGYLVQSVTAPPSPAENLTITDISDNSLTLQWEAGTRPAEKYNIYRVLEASTDPYLYIGSVSGTNDSDGFTYTLSGLDSGTTYTFVVRGAGSGKESVDGMSATACTAQSGGNSVTINPLQSTYSVAPGDSVTMKTNVASSPGIKSLTMVWQARASGTSTWRNIDGETGISLTLSDVTQNMDGSQYRLRVKATTTSSNVGYFYSNAATLSVSTTDTAATLKVENYTDGTGTLSPYDPYTGNATTVIRTPIKGTEDREVPVTFQLDSTEGLVYQVVTRTMVPGSEGEDSTLVSTPLDTPVYIGKVSQEGTGSESTISYYALTKNADGTYSAVGSAPLAVDDANITVGEGTDAKTYAISDLEQVTITQKVEVITGYSNETKAGTKLTLSATLKKADGSQVLSGIGADFIITNQATGTSEIIHKTSGNDGTISTDWTASSAGLYVIQVSIPGSDTLSSSLTEPQYYYASSQGSETQYRLRLKANSADVAGSIVYGSTIALVPESKTGTGEWAEIGKGSGLSLTATLQGGTASTITGTSYAPDTAGKYTFSLVKTEDETSTTLATATLTITPFKLTVTPVWEGTIPSNLDDVTLKFTDASGQEITSLPKDDKEKLEGALVKTSTYFDSSTPQPGVYYVNLSWNNEKQSDITALTSAYSITLSSASFYKIADAAPVFYQVVGGSGSVYANGEKFISFNSGDQQSQGTPLRFQATPDTGYLVKSWKINGNVVSADSPDYVVDPISGGNAQMLTISSFDTARDVSDGKLLVQVEFSNQISTVNYSAGAGGSLTAKTSQGTPVQTGTNLAYGANVVFTAAPGEGQMVEKWTVAVNNGTAKTYTWPESGEPYRENTLTLSDLAEGSYTVSVEFTQKQTFTVEAPVFVDDSGSLVKVGTITMTDASGWPVSAGDELEQGKTITYTVEFTDSSYNTVNRWEYSTDGTNWTSDSGSGQLTYSCRKDSTGTLYVRAVVSAPQTYKLNWSVSGCDTATLTAKSGDSTLTSGGSYAFNTLVNFTLGLDNSYYVVGWSGVTPAADGKSATLTLTGKTDVTVTVAKKPVVTISSDNGSVTYKATKNGIEQTLSTSSYVDLGSNVTFTAKPAEGYRVKGWYSAAGDAEPIIGTTSGQNSYTIENLRADTSVYVAFEAIPIDEGGGGTTGGGGGGGGGGAIAPSETVVIKDSVNGKVTADNKTAAKGDTVTLTVTPDKGYTLETLLVTDKNGDELKLTEKNGKYTFTMPASNVTVKATFMEDNSMLNFFVDVPADAYYYDAVLWAVENGITSGVDETHFAPNATCTRAQAVTFLWRAAGSPEPESSEMTFTDVAEGSYYHDAVLWAVENGITKGTSDTTFSPDATCSRGQIVTFLWRSQESPDADGANPFTDVADDAYYADAVLWAVENGITTGTADTTFSPSNDCTRAQIVTFLWRALAE